MIESCIPHVAITSLGSISAMHMEQDTALSALVQHCSKKEEDSFTWKTAQPVLFNQMMPRRSPHLERVVPSTHSIGGVR